jgi:hypothetical protein
MNNIGNIREINFDPRKNISKFKWAKVILLSVVFAFTVWLLSFELIITFS